MVQLCVLRLVLCRATSGVPLVLYLPSLEAWALNAATLSPSDIDEEQEEQDVSSAGQGHKGRAAQRDAQPSITPLKAYPASLSPFR